MENCNLAWLGRFGVTALVGLGTTLTFAGLGDAQVIPDATLGAESSRVQAERITGRDGVTRDSEVIEGGAQRGGNLFHSFEQFDVPEGRGAYFGNPADVQNIFSRVTSADRSEIFGTLGVLGNANLFFLNPNGILFGPNASLDIQGSFVGSTGNGIWLGDQGFFSATTPEQSNLLEVNPGALFFNQVAAQGGSITSSGNLATGQDLTLAGQNLDLQGRVVAGRDLTLQAQDILRIRDSVTTPFVAASGGAMLVQGNQAVDIFALNHPNSGLVSGGDMALRSGNTVSGDAHFSSGNNFLISGLSDQSTSFTSLFDPIISSVGDVEVVGDYSGASLIVESQGNVQFRGNISIDKADTSLIPLNANSDIQLASQTPALIIRSGQNSLIFPRAALPIIVNDAIAQTSSSASQGITLGGDVNIQYGTVILNASSGDVRTQNISTGLINYSGNRGPILINANGNIITGNLTSGVLVNAPAGASGEAGEIRLSTTGDITTGNIQSGIGSRDANGIGGEVDISTINGTIRTGDIFSGFFVRTGTGDGGNITISTINGDISVGSINSFSLSNLSSTGNGGNIRVYAPSGNITTGEINSSSLSSSGITNNGGSISFVAGGSIKSAEVNSSTNSLNSLGDIGVGDGGMIKFEAGDSITIEELNSQSRSRNSDAGNGGLLTLSAGNDINTSAILTSAESILAGAGVGGSANLSSANGAITTGNINTFGEARGGNVTLTANRDINVKTDDVSLIDASGVGAGGNITLDTQGNFLLRNGLLNSSSSQSSGGSIKIEASSISLINTDLRTTSSQGSSGNITVIAPNLISLDQSRLFTALEPGAIGESGNIQISSGSLTLDAFSLIDTATFGEGNAGQVSIKVNNSVSLNNNSRIFSITSGQGNAGDVILWAGDNVFLDNLSSISTATDSSATGGGSDINVVAVGRLQLSNGSSLNSQTFNAFAGGEISVKAGTADLRTGGQILTNTFSNGRAGEIFVEVASNEIVIAGTDPSFSNRLIPAPLKLAESPIPLLEQAENDSIQQAQNIDNYFAVDPNSNNLNPDILSSTRIPYVSIISESSVQKSSDYYSLNISTAGTRAIFDVDGGIELNEEGNPYRGTNTSLALLDSQGVPLTNGSSTKASPTLGGEGSVGEEDPYLQFVFTKPGLYYIQIDRSDSSPAPADYNLQVSLDVPNVERDIDPSSGLFARTRDSGAAGSIALNTPRLSLQNGAQINAATATSSSGRSGNIVINAPERITLAGNSELSVETNGAGRAGDIALSTNTLDVEQTARITATATANATTTEQGGNIILNVNQIDLAGTVGLFSETQGVAPAGTLMLHPYRNQPNININLQGGAQISASTTGGGQGGNLILMAPGVITIQGNGQLAAETRATGNAGSITVTADSLTLGNGADISATATETATATTQGGNLQLNVNHLNLSGVNTGLFAATRGAAPAGELQLNPNQSQNLTVNLSDGSTLSAATSGNGQGGNLIVKAPGSVTLQGSGQLTTASIGTGDAGNLSITANTLILRNGTQVTAATDGGGNAGNIRIRADQVSLSNSNISTEVGETGVGQGGSIDIQTGRLNLQNHSNITSSTSGIGDTGSISVAATEGINLRNNSSISNRVETGATGNSQRITLDTPNLTLRGDSAISAATDGNGSAGDIQIQNANTVSLSNSRISTQVQRNAVVSNNPNNRRQTRPRSNTNQGNITIDARSLELNNGAAITASTNGQGRAGNVRVNDANQISLNNSSISSAVRGNGQGSGGNVNLETRNLDLTNHSRITANTANRGDAGNIRVQNANQITANNNSRISSTVQQDARGQGGNITLDTAALELENAQISANTNGRGNAGNISVQNVDRIAVDQGRISTAVNSSDSGRGGSISLETGTLSLENARVNATTVSRRPAGSITVNATGDITANDSQIETSSQRSSGGDIQLSANLVRLNNSDIQTTLKSGTAAGGNISVDADAVIAGGDSDIISAAPEGSGGDITLPLFFGQNYQANLSEQEALGTLNGNGRVDINANGQISSGAVQTPDTSFIQNSLSDLPNNAIDTENLLANSCIARTENGGVFLITGTGGLPPNRPSSAPLSPYPTDTVRTETTPDWRLGDPIVEPQGIYRLPNGELVMMHDCPAN